MSIKEQYEKESITIEVNGRKQTYEPKSAMHDKFLREMIKEQLLSEKTGGSKTYQSLLKLEKGIRDLEKTFAREKRDMDDERASNVKKSIGNIKQSWTAIWADFNER